MARSTSEFPTELELEILKLLWDESPLPVREVRRRLDERSERPLAHSTVITMLNIMHRKGYVKRKKDGKSFLFSPKVSEDNIAGGILTDLVTRLFDGSASAMVLNLLNSAELDEGELGEIRKMIAKRAKEGKQ